MGGSNAVLKEGAIPLMKRVAPLISTKKRRNKVTTIAFRIIEISQLPQ